MEILKHGQINCKQGKQRANHPTVPESRGGFENPPHFGNAAATMRNQKRMDVDSLAMMSFPGEGGEFTLGFSRACFLDFVGS